MKGHPGLTREAQVRALLPYLNLLSEGDLWSLWEECNRHGWFDVRRLHLDALLPQPLAERWLWDRARAAVELDDMITRNHS